MPSEIDINLIFLRLEKLEERIKVLEDNKLKPDDYYQIKAGTATTPVVQRYPGEEEWREEFK